MKRITTLIVSMLLIASSVWARTPEEAAAIASGFMSQKGSDASVVQRVQRAKSTGVAQSTVSLEYIQATKANDNAVYVFNHTDGGFVLVSAIDNSREVLGYNDNGRFDKNNIPKNMQFWLQMYADELASVDKTATRSVSAKAATSTYTAVSPILDCTWGQSWPYNEMCPTIGSDHDANGNIFPIWVAGIGELPRVAFSVSGNTAYFGEEVELNEFTIRVKKGALCDMVTSDGLYLWWWVTNQDGQLANLTLNADGWYTTTITTTATSINCLAVNVNVVDEGWIGQQTGDYLDITGDICLSLTGSSSSYILSETACSTPSVPSNDVVFDADVDQGNAGTDSNNAAEYVITKDDVTMTVSSGILGTYNSECHYRIYKNQTLTLTSTAGNITKVEFTCTANDDEKYGPGCFTVDGGSYEYSGVTGTWTGDVSSVTFAASTNQVRATQVVVSCESASGPISIPTASDLAQYEQDGYFVACINFQGEVCNDIVFVGSYNGWSTTPEEMVHFTPLGGFDGWYVAVVPVVYDEYGAEANEGKPVQLRNNGEFSWEYQTGDASSWELIAGSVDIYAGYDGESNLQYWSSAEPVILKSAGWKNDQSPCDEAPEQEYTIYLNAPDCGGFEPAIIGDFNNWVEGVAMAPIGDGWYQAVVNSMPGRRVNFRASTSADWSNAIQIYDSEYGAWSNIADYYLTEETTINLDYSAGKYTLCENDVPTPECYTLNVNVAEGGYVNISPEADCYEEGTQITLTAEADEGYHFVRWSDGNTDNPRLLTMTEDIFLTAEFTYTPLEEHSFTIRVKKDDVSDMDLSNGLYLYWWKTDEAGPVATMTLDSDGWYTTTITTTATSINCLAVNVNVDSEGWIGQQTTDYTNITGDICLAIGTNDGFYNGNYNLYAVPCEDVEYTREHDFEDTDANAQWRFVQDGQINYWTIGSAAGSMDGGSNALYITSDGYNYAYEIDDATSTSWAYLPVNLNITDSITFSWKGYGESCCDYLRVYLLPKGYTPLAGNTELPEVAISLSDKLNGVDEWQHFAAMAGVEGEYNLCLMWQNDYSVGQTPIAIDNISIATIPSATDYPLTYVLNNDGTAVVAMCDPTYSGELTIPASIWYDGRTYSVTAIGENAFNQCNITSLDIPNSVTTIGTYAFFYCYSLTSVTLPENLTAIEDYTFSGCESLAAITIPNNVQSIGEGAFADCYNLTSVAIGSGVTSIAYFAFGNCGNLTSLTIPSSVTDIASYAFWGTRALTSIVVENGNAVYDSRNNCNAIIHTASNTLVHGCQSTIIPESVIYIGDGAFSQCDNLVSITIPSSVLSIGTDAFYCCDNLSSVDLGEGVQTIGSYAFDGCYTLTSVTIPASVTSIGSWAFYNCSNIVMEGTTPPQIYSSTFNSDASIWVPCTAVETYQTADYWNELNIQGSSYAVTLSATEGGSAQITYSDCATNTVTIEAYPYERYTFIQWSDGNTDNPRTLTLTEDIALTAEFTILTYPVTNLVVTTNCGKAYASWEGDAPYYELTMYSIDGTVVLYDLVPNHYKDGVSNSNPYEEGDYYCQVRPMYSNSEGDYAGEAVQAPFTISADNCVDIEIHDLSYTITDETTVNLTWNSEAYVYHVQLYDYQNNLIADEYINTNSYSYTLPEMGRYSFYVLGYNEDQTQFSSWQNISFDIVYSNWEYDLNFVYGEQGDNGTWNDAYQRPIHLYSEDYQTVMRIYPMPKYENSIIGTYFVENNTDNLYAGGMWGDGSYITYNGISTGAIQSGMVTIARNEENKFVVSFDLTDANGINYTNTCTIENMSGSNITDDNVTALSASQALTLTQNLPDYNLTTMPYMVNGVISRITSYDVNLYSRARFYISEDGSTTNEFYCYNTSWLNNTSFTTGDEIAEGDTVVIYGNLQNYQGTTPEIKGYVYQHFAKEVDESCYTLTVDATEGGYVSISPEADCYEAGTQVVITATPNENYEFATWSDGNTSAQRTIVMDKDYNLTATFRSTSIPTNNYTLTLTCDEGGTVGKNPNYEYYEENSTVTIFANANEGYKFVQWSDGNTESVRSITITQDMVLHATFVEEQTEQFTLTLTASEGGTAIKVPDQESYNAGSTVTIIAQANDGYEFVTWSDGNTSAQRTIVMDKDYNLTATFRSTSIPTNNYTLTLTCDEGGTVGKNPNYEYYEENSTVTIFANANEGYKFVQWSDGNTESVRSITITQDMVLHATFVEEQTEQFTLTLTASEGGTAIKVPDQASYNAGSIVTIIAQANNGYEFVQWSDGNTENVRSITMTQDMVLHATFVEEQKEQFTLTLTAGEGGTVNKTPDQPSYAAGSVVTITAQANEGFEFVSWSDGDKNSVRHITMTQNVVLHATFTRIASNYDITNLSVTSSNKRITAKWESIATRFEIVITDSNNEVEHSEKVDITDDSKVYKYTAKKLGTYTVTIKPLNASDQQIGIEDSKTVTLVMKYTLFISTENENAGTVNEEVNGDYVDGETVEIVATPKNGYRFKMWDDGDTNAKRTLVMNQDYYLTASFSRIPTYTLTISEGENGLASMAAGSYTYKENEEVTITPLPYDGYVFDHWVVNGIENTTETLTLVMTQDYSVYPVCVSKPIPTYTLTILPGEYGKANMEAGTYTYQEGEEVTLLPIADTDYLFDQWVVNDEVNTDSVLVLVMDKDYTVMPTFIPNQVGVENIYDGITILVEQWTITVEATQAQDIALYDLVGHLIEQQPHTRIASFTVPSAGLYLIRTSSGVKKVRVE